MVEICVFVFFSGSLGKQDNVLHSICFWLGYLKLEIINNFPVQPHKSKLNGLKEIKKNEIN